MGQYDHLERDALIRLLQRRAAERQLGKDFLLLHKSADRLESDGPFALERLRWA